MKKYFVLLLFNFTLSCVISFIQPTVCFGLDYWDSQSRFNSNYFDMSSNGKMFYYIEESHSDLPVLYMEPIDKTMTKDSILFDSSNVVCFKLSPDNNHFIVGYANGNLELWNIVEKRIEKTLLSNPASNSNKQIRFSENGEEFTELFCLNPINIHRWKIETEEIISEFSVSENFYENNFCLSNNGEFLILKNNLDTLKAWNVKSKELIFDKHAIQETLTNIAISDNGNFIVYSNNADEIKIFDINTQQFIKTLKENNWINSVQILQNMYAVFDSDSNLVIYDFVNDVTKNYKNFIDDYSHEQPRLSFSYDFSIVSVYKGRNLSCPNDMPAFANIIEIYNLNDEKLLKRLSEGHTDAIAWIGFSGDGNVVCTQDATGLMYIWDVQTGKSLCMLNKPSFYRLSPKGDYLISVRNDSILNFDYKTETITGTWINKKGPISYVLVNHNDILVVSESSDSLFFINYPDDNVVSAIPKERSSQFYFVMNRNWTEVTLFYKDLFVYKYDLKTGNIISTNIIDSAFIKLPLASISYDGNYIAFKVPYYWPSGSIKVWDVNLGKYIYDSKGGYISWAKFSLDSKKLWMHTVDPVLYTHFSNVYNFETQEYSCEWRWGMSESYTPDLIEPFVFSPDGSHAMHGSCSGYISYFKLCDDFISYVNVESPINITSSISNLIIYPNPIDETITISYNLSIYGKVKLSLFDQLGSEVVILKESFEEPGGFNYQLTINNYQLAQGIYYLNIQIGNERQSRKIIFLK